MENIAEKLLELSIAAKKITKLENDGKGGAKTLGLKEKFLFALFKRPHTPMALTDILMIDKANLTHLANSAIKDGFAQKKANKSDKRQIEYSLTIEGKDYIRMFLSKMEENFKNLLTKESEYVNAVDSINEVIKLISFM